MAASRADVSGDSGPAPPLSPALECTLRRCGPHAHLLIDDVITADRGFSAAMSFTAQQGQTPSRVSRVVLWSEPLQRALLAGRVPCRCSPLGQMTIRSLSPSGSTAEGLDDGSNVLNPSSDQDIMHELGPARWVSSGAADPDSAQDTAGCADPGYMQDPAGLEDITGTAGSGSVQCTASLMDTAGTADPGSVQGTIDLEDTAGPTNAGSAQGAADVKNIAGTADPGSAQGTADVKNIAGTADPGAVQGTAVVGATSRPGQSAEQDLAETPRLRIVSTANPGFVRVLQQRLATCPHREELEFSGEIVRQFMRDFCSVDSLSKRILSTSGPATSFSESGKRGQPVDIDVVPCLHLPEWPSDEFFTRHRQRDWPPRAARDDMRQFGVHLVPVGARGSATEHSEWRLSFSRPEVVAAWHISQVQRCALTALKICKGVLGPQAKALKSYFMKTALLWLSQETPSEELASATMTAQMILQYLQKAVSNRQLPCFFCVNINLLKLTTQEELNAMETTIRYIRHHMLRLLAFELSGSIQDFVPLVLTHPAEELSERQLRLLLSRWRLRCGVIVSCSMHMLGVPVNWCEIIPHLLRSSARAELACLAHQANPQRCLQENVFQALSVAPEDVMIRTRLSRDGSGDLIWDAAPLVELLTAEDVHQLLFDPPTVHAWLRRQHRLPPAQRPAGLSADLSSPRGLAALLLNIPLLARALSEAVPSWHAAMQRAAREQPRYPVRTSPPFEVARAAALSITLEEMVAAFRASLGMDELAAQSAAALWEEGRQRLVADPRTRAEHDRIRSTVSDP